MAPPRALLGELTVQPRTPSRISGDCFVARKGIGAREWVEGRGQAGKKRKVGEEREEGRKEGKEGD